jgi:integrase
MELIGRNPCEAVTRPSVPRSNAKALSPDEVARLFATTRGTRWESFVALALSTGARRGELCGLSWRDFDAEGGTLTIRCSLAQTRHGTALKATKTGHTRMLPLSRVAKDALRSQRALQARDRLANGGVFDNAEDAIFTDEVGHRITPMAAPCAFERLARKAAISTTRLHDLRHTAATTLLVAGIDVRTAAGVLGHSSPTVTLTTYAHLMPEAQRNAVDRLGERLEHLAAVGFDEERQPNGNRLAADIKKSLQIQAISCSANGNRTRYRGCRVVQPTHQNWAFSLSSNPRPCGEVQSRANLW